MRYFCMLNRMKEIGRADKTLQRCGVNGTFIHHWWKGKWYLEAYLGLSYKAKHTLTM